MKNYKSVKDKWLQTLSKQEKERNSFAGGAAFVRCLVLNNFQYRTTDEEEQ